MRQFATFSLGDRMFGLDIRMIREINRIPDITPLPHAALSVRGLINLRGQIVTILDLGVRLGLPRKPIGPTSHNIILKAASELPASPQTGNAKPNTTAEHPIGLLVDAIGDVVEVDESRIEPLSANVGETERRFLSGVIKLDDGLLVLPDIQQVLNRG